MPDVVLVIEYTVFKKQTWVRIYGGQCACVCVCVKVVSTVGGNSRNGGAILTGCSGRGREGVAV